MDSIVADTDVVSYLLKGDTRVESFRAHLEIPGRVVIISFMTVAELDRWVIKQRWAEARRARMDEFLSRRFVTYDLMDRALCRTWAIVSSQVDAKGRHISCADAWVAATALALGCPLLTHNRLDYEAVSGLVLLATSDQGS